MPKRIAYTTVIYFYFLISTGFTPFEDSVLQTISHKDSLLKVELTKIKHQLLLKIKEERNAIRINVESTYNTFDLGNPVEIKLNDSSYFFACSNNNQAVIYFQNLQDLKLKIYEITNSIQSNATMEECKLKIGNTILSTYRNRKQLLVEIKNYFTQIQKLSNDLLFKVNEFEAWVNEYKMANPKPEILEQQHKYIIQADAAVKLYQYEKAIELNRQVILIHPTSYKKAYFNIAILQAESNRLFSAIYNMKKYLQLSSEENSETFAGNKIKEWEVILNN